jgi:hypothetical protein
MYTCVRAERKKGRVQNATDLGVEDWRIPVGRAETTRKGEREGGGGLLTTIMGTTREKENEEKRTGRGGTRVGATRKNREGGGVPIDVGTGGGARE